MPVVPGPSTQSAISRCNACNQPIPPDHPRVHCLACADLDLCAVCALGERFGAVERHSEGHPTAIYRVSGDNAVPAVLSRASVSYSSSGGTSPAPPTAPASSVNGGTHRPPDGWAPLFYADMSHTPGYATLMNTIFAHSDTARSGLLSPEGYSRLLDDMGYTTQQNIWKNNLRITIPGQSRESGADDILKRAYDSFGVEHVVQSRSGAASSNNTFKLFSGGGFSSSSMPLLTPRGLAQIIAIELLSDPSSSHPRLARVLHTYGIDGIEPYRRWGALPREVLPPVPDPRMLARLGGAQVQSVQNAQISAQILAQANLAAVNAIGGAQYEYRRF
ncbi:hypothetical protein FB45DRAFT_922745 [Roridomyces roridus]|uniref:DUF7514 domain-containing protein n=1 Tax=Roridomyces roridus TaxID=1738132 RepID=A0AAD7BNR1_9AGAR|nr:hypothetical protein FB45DRAFT_922745 [Roridomyces roridus]